MVKRRVSQYSPTTSLQLTIKCQNGFTKNYFQTIFSTTICYPNKNRTEQIQQNQLAQTSTDAHIHTHTECYHLEQRQPSGLLVFYLSRSGHTGPLTTTLPSVEMMQQVYLTAGFSTNALTFSINWPLMVRNGHCDVQTTAELSDSACHVCLRHLCNVSFSHRATAGPPSGLQRVSAVPASMCAANASSHPGFMDIQIILNIFFLCKPSAHGSGEYQSLTSILRKLFSAIHFHISLGADLCKLSVMEVVWCATQILCCTQVDGWIKVGLILSATPLAQTTHLPRWKETAVNGTKTLARGQSLRQ